MRVATLDTPHPHPILLRMNSATSDLGVKVVQQLRARNLRMAGIDESGSEVAEQNPDFRSVGFDDPCQFITHQGLGVRQASRPMKTIQGTPVTLRFDDQITASECKKTIQMNTTTTEPHFFSYRSYHCSNVKFT